MRQSSTLPVAVLTTDQLLLRALGDLFRQSRQAEVAGEDHAAAVVVDGDTCAYDGPLPCVWLASVDKGGALPKPVALDRLFDALGAALEQSGAASAPQEVPLPGGVRLEVVGNRLRVGEGVIALTDKETALLLALHEAGEGVDRDVLLTQVWGYASDAETTTLETHIYRLRRKLREGGAPFSVVTVDRKVMLAVNLS